MHKDQPEHKQSDFSLRVTHLFIQDLRPSTIPELLASWPLFVISDRMKLFRIIQV